MMQMNFENLVSKTEENKNISKVARQEGDKEMGQNELPQQSTVDEVGNLVLSKHLDAFKELAK